MIISTPQILGLLVIMVLIWLGSRIEDSQHGGIETAAHLCGLEGGEILDDDAPAA